MAQTTEVSFDPADYGEDSEEEEPAPAPALEEVQEKDECAGPVTVKGWEGWMKAKDRASGHWCSPHAILATHDGHVRYYYNPVNGDRQWAPDQQLEELESQKKPLGEFYGYKKGETGNQTAAVAAAKQTSNMVFFDVSVGGLLAGRIEIELFDDQVPKTAANFRALCTGEAGRSRSGANLHYKNSRFHRIIPGFMCQAGDFTRGDGSGGESIYGRKFDDENFNLTHSAPGILSMANSGPVALHPFPFIFTSSCPGLEWFAVLFDDCSDSLVAKGMKVVKEIEAVGSESGKPQSSVVIEDCGIVGAEEEKPEAAPEEEQLQAEEPKGATMSTAEWLAQAGGEGWCYLDLKKKKQLYAWKAHLPPNLKVWQAAGGTGVETELRHLLPIAAEGWQSLTQRAQAAEEKGVDLDAVGGSNYTEYATKGFWNARTKRFQADEGMLTCPDYKDGWDMTQDAAAVYRNCGLERYCDVTQLERTLKEKADRKRKAPKMTRKQIEAAKERKKAIKRRIEKEKEDYLDSIV